MKRKTAKVKKAHKKSPHPRKLNIGCGKDIRKGYINLDRAKLPGVDVIWDLDVYPYPFKDHEFDEILCWNVIEHLSDHCSAMREMHRILKKGGRLIISTSHFSCATAYRDPTHKWYPSIESFDFFVKGKNDREYYFDFAFSKIVKKKLTFGKKFSVWNYLIEPLANRFPHLYEDSPLRVFPALELHIELEK